MLSGNKVHCQNKDCQKKIDSVNDFLCPHCGHDPMDMNIQPALTEAAQKNLQLNEKIHELGKKFEEAGFDIFDARCQFTGVCHTYLELLNIELSLFRDNLMDYDSGFCLIIKKTIHTTDNKKVGDYLKLFDIFKRNSFLTMWMFRVEILLKEIKKKLPEKPVKESIFKKFLIKLGYRKEKRKESGYKNLVKYVLKELDMRGIDCENYNILYFPAIIRNCLHNNGTFTENNTNGRIKGIPFNFVKGEDTYYAGWRHIHFFCWQQVELIKNILKHEKIKDIPMPTK